MAYNKSTTNPAFKTSDGRYWCLTFPNAAIQQVHDDYDVVSLPSKTPIKYTDSDGKTRTNKYKTLTVNHVMDNGNGLSHGFVSVNGKYSDFIEHQLDRQFVSNWNRKEACKTLASQVQSAGQVSKLRKGINLQDAYSTASEQSHDAAENIKQLGETIDPNKDTENIIQNDDVQITLKNTAHYKILSAKWIDDLMAQEQDEKKQLLLRQCVNDYNTAVNFANDHQLEIDVLNISDEDHPSLDAFIQHRTAIYESLCNACHETNIDENEIPEMGSTDSMEEIIDETPVKKTTIGVNKAVAFNIERGLQCYDGNSLIKKQFADGTYTASFNSYAFSEFEQCRLESGEKIIITECPMNGDSNYKNILCHLQKSDEPTINGDTHELVIDQYVKVTSPVFADASLNEKYHLQQERFDALIAASHLGREIQIKQANVEDKRARKAFETIEDKASKARGYKKNGTMDAKNENMYFLDSYLEINGKDKSKITSKEFSKELRDSTKLRTVNKPASEKGQALGFDTMYDEQRFNRKSAHSNKTLTKIKEAIDYASEHCPLDATAKYEYLKSADTYKELYERDCERYAKEKEMRQQPVSDDALKAKHIENAFEEYVYNRYNEIHKDDDTRLTRADDEHYIDDRYETLKRSIDARQARGSEQIVIQQASLPENDVTFEQ